MTTRRTILRGSAGGAPGLGGGIVEMSFVATAASVAGPRLSWPSYWILFGFISTQLLVLVFASAWAVTPAGAGEATSTGRENGNAHSTPRSPFVSSCCSKFTTIGVVTVSIAATASATTPLPTVI